MKKLIALLLAAVMALGMAACGAAKESAPTTTAPADTTDTTPADTTDTTPAVSDSKTAAVLTAIWDLYTEDHKFFAMGGDFNAPVDGAPGAVDVANADFLTYNLLVPEAEQAGITGAASLIHGMNANTFTAGAYEVADAAAFATAMQTAIQGNQWVCGFPETLVIASVEGVVIVAFGVNDAMTPFQTYLTTAYPAAELLVNEPIAG